MAHLASAAVRRLVVEWLGLLSEGNKWEVRDSRRGRGPVVSGQWSVVRDQDVVIDPVARSNDEPDLRLLTPDH